MKLLEYEAKRLLQLSAIPTPKGELVDVAVSHSHKGDSPSFPAVVKSQVPVGGRGKLGGIKVVKNLSEYRAAIDVIGKLSIKNYVPNALLVEEAVDINREFYLSLVINRSRGTIDLLAHPDGGVEVESQEGFFSLPLSGSNTDVAGESLAELYGLEDKSFLLAEWVEKLYRCFIENDATLIEINPLILTKQGDLVAGDCKMTLDDDAAFRHPDWNFEDKPANANFVSLDTKGTVATIANGAGLAMATVDAVQAAGLTPANFLDIGGGATTEQVVASFRQIMEFKHVNSIVINIFGGIVQCDTVAQAIIEAREQLPSLPTLYIRLSGNRSQEAAVLLANHNLPLYSDLAECIKELRHES